MSSIDEWIRKRFRAEVDAGVGAWSSTVRSSALGQAIYEYRDESVAVRLHERGLSYARKDEPTDLKYEEILTVNVMPLKRLMRVHDKPKEIVELGLSCASGEVCLKIPMELYSELAPTLCGIVDRLRTP